jgi:diacylglycerol kinase family enzyme
MRVVLIHNASAGDHNQPDAEGLQEMIRQAGHELCYRSTSDENWAAALHEPADLIAVAGGDGTIGRVAASMVDGSTPLAVLPMGTANNISHTLGIAGVSLPELIAAWERGHMRKLEVGIALGPWGRRRFIEGLGAGVFAWTIPYADNSGTLASLTTTEPKISYALQMLKDRLLQCPPVSISAMVDNQDVSGDYILFEAMATRYIGPNLHLAPHVDSADGRLDVVMARESERDVLRDYLSSWQDGARAPVPLPTLRGRRVVMQWTGFHLHIDDQVWPDEGAKLTTIPARVEAAIEPTTLNVLVPEQISTPIAP